MAAIQFPNNPTLNQVYTSDDGDSWKWNGYAWLSQNSYFAPSSNGSVEMYDTFTDFPTIGQDNVLYVTKDANIVYRYDTFLNTYVITNDPDVINPDAPEEGGTFYVRLATSSRLNTCVYANGASGDGATLTGSVNGIVSDITVAGKIDNVIATLGDVLLIKNQVSALQNGIYEVTQLGSISEPFILTRIDGYNQTDEIYPSIVFVSAGSNNANRYFTQSTLDPVIGVNNLVYSVASTAQPFAPLLFVDTVTAAALPTCTYANGTTYVSLPGWGATLTADVNGALGIINGVNMTSGLKIIVKDQVNQAHNGTYNVTNAGSATQKWVLTRWLSDSSQWHLGREFTVTNPSCNQYGSRWSVSSPLTMSNLSYGITNIIFSQKNIYGLKDSPNSIYVNGPSIGVSDFTIETDNTIALGVYNNLDVSDFSIEAGAIRALVTDGTKQNTLSVEMGGIPKIELSSSDGNTSSTLELLSNTASLNSELLTIGTSDLYVYTEYNSAIGRYKTEVYDGVDIESSITITSTDGSITLFSTNGSIDATLDIDLVNGINLAHTSYVTIGTDSGTNGIEIDGTDMSFYTSGNGTIFINDAHGIRLSPSQAVGNGMKISISSLPTYADDTAAGVGGLITDMVYKTATGELRIKL